MVKKVQAYDAEDGTVHLTEHAAHKHVARKAIQALGIFNEATLKAVFEHAVEIAEALAPVIATMPVVHDKQTGNVLFRGDGTVLNAEPRP